MTQSIETGLGQVIDRIYVINLESRPDRRREMVTELKRIGLDADSPLVAFFKAVRPEDAGSFPSIGARGCFMSHLGILRNAHENRYRKVMILEDDAAFTANYAAQAETILKELDTVDWSIAYLGHRIAPDRLPGPAPGQSPHWRALPHDTGIETTHAMVIHGNTFAPLISYLERMLARPAGHAEGGPMHVDGAYSWFRRDHPDRLTLVTPQQYVTQRASKSDIAPPSWKDRLPFLARLRQFKNRLSKNG